MSKGSIQTANPKTNQKRVTRIEPLLPKRQQIIRAAAYCRVSTSRDVQLDSLRAQREHYETMIRRHENWALAGIYCDEGITGTKREVRPQLEQLLEDCREGHVDLILTKSISRFSRNMTDCLEMVRELSSLGVHLIFEKENIDTRRMESEFILTVLSSMAQEESKSLSRNVQWTAQKNFRSGTFLYSRAPYGYDLMDGNFVINQKEAAVVRWIYDRILEGKGTSWIAGELNRMKVPTKQEIENRGGKGRAAWFATTVSDLVKNPVYIGDVLMQKTFHDESLRRHDNYGECTQFYQDDHHAPIIDRESFELACACIRQRAIEGGTAGRSGAQRHMDPRSSRYCFSGKVICGQCGSTMKRVTQYTKSGRIYHRACEGRLTHRTDCTLKRVSEDSLQNAFLTMINKLRFAPFILDSYIQETQQSETGHSGYCHAEILRRLQQNTQRRHRLALLLLKGCVEPLFYKRETAALEAEAADLRAAARRMEENSVQTRAARDFRDFVRKTDTAAFNNVIAEAFAEHVEKVIVCSRTCFTFCMKCGLTLTEQAVENA